MERVVIVDNGSTELREWLAKEARERSCELVLLDHNAGVAAAHNLGVARARTLGADLLLLLDQDSLPAPGMVPALTNALLDLQRSGEPVGAVGPRHVDQKSRAESPFVRFGFLSTKHFYCGGDQKSGFIECDHLITSGTLIPASVLDRIGGLDEGLFIDNVDTEWCFRAKSTGYKLFGVCSAHMLHAIGDSSVKIWLPLADRVVVHRPPRLYYIVRNHVLLYGRRHTPGAWIVQDVPRLIFKFVVFATSVSPRFLNLIMMMKGLRDGIRGKTGPYGNPVGL